MILRKPYAFFIKNFRLIHVIITIMMAYLIYKTGSLLTFFNEYLSSSSTVTGQDLTGYYFNIYMYLIPFLVVLASIIILSVMYVKKKPLVFYVVNILTAVAILFIYGYTNSVMTTMEVKLVDIRVIRVVRDLLMMSFFIQSVSVVITLVRATGFDIKKFNFGEDLEELEISEADNEEFEVDVEVDTDILKRDFRRKLRYFKYTYIENKFLINISVLIVIGIVCFITYLNVGVYNKTYSENVAFVTQKFTMRINESYLTQNDYSGKNISGDNYLVIVSLDLKNRSKVDRQLEQVKTVLNIDNHKFYPTIKYRDSLIDIGNTYQNENISKESFQNYILVYEIPKEYINKKMLFNYIDDTNYFSDNLEPKTIKIKLNYRDLDNVSNKNGAQIGDTLILADSIFNKTRIKINSYEVSQTFTVSYNYCIDSSLCYPSTEYLKPDIYNNYDKVLLKVNAYLTWDEDLKTVQSSDVYKFISMYGKLKYNLNGETKYQNIPFKEVKSNRVSGTNNYYIEVVDEVKKADDISLIFKIRDCTYEYTLK